uniref:Reverse transcriptase domain-containing protein n=1 Tax=Tanacetum cinerariifolium TaxID=118510 RepID=A0A6L2K8H2_TANCI|nr:hypothetical protein [Tanacetum cinerariifolium]
MGDAGINTLTMEQYLAITRGNQAPGLVKAKIRGNVNFEIKSQFMMELREDTFLGNKNNDAYKHVERILGIIILFNILGLTHDAVMLCVFPITLTGAAKRWVDKLSIFRNNQHLGFAQEGLHSKHDGSTSQMVSNDSSNRYAAITNKLDSLERDIKKIKENVHAIQVGYKNCGGAHLNKEHLLHEEFKNIKEVKYEEFVRPFLNNRGNMGRYRVEETKEVEEIKEVAAQHETTHQKVSPGNLPVVNYYVAPYEPPIPFPRRLKQHAKEALVYKAMERLKRVKVIRPLLKEIRHTDDYAKHIKNLMENKSRTLENENVKMNIRCSAILQTQLPPKEQDPGSFTFPCSIRKVIFDALADLGESISIMPLLMFKRHGRRLKNAYYPMLGIRDFYNLVLLVQVYGAAEDWKKII